MPISTLRLRRLCVCFGLAFMFLGSTGTAQAAVDMFLKVAGIPGDSNDAAHKGDIDVLAWSWGASQSGTTHVGGGGGAGVVNIQDLSLTKYLDRASPKLMQAVFSGQHIASVILYVRYPSGNKVEFLKVTLTEVLVSSYQTGGSGGEDRLTENVTFNFAKVQIEYVPLKPDGTPDAKIPAGWDILQNKAA